MGAPTTRVAVWLLLPFPGGGRGCKLGQPLHPGSVWKPKDGMLARAGPYKPGLSTPAPSMSMSLTASKPRGPVPASRTKRTWWGPSEPRSRSSKSHRQHASDDMLSWRLGAETRRNARGAARARAFGGPPRCLRSAIELSVVVPATTPQPALRSSVFCAAGGTLAPPVCSPAPGRLDSRGLPGRGEGMDGLRRSVRPRKATPNPPGPQTAEPRHNTTTTTAGCV